MLCRRVCRPRDFYGELKRSRLQPVLSILSGVMRNSKLLVKIFENMKRVTESGSAKSYFFVGKDTVGLPPIAVAPRLCG